MREEEEITQRKIEREQLLRARTSTSKLPEMKISPFDGSARDWIRFENMFKAQIDSKSISDSEKFGYLLESVKPKVREKLANLKPGEQGYLDTGSGRNFISKEAVEQLRLSPSRHETRNILTVNGTKRTSMPVFEVKINSLDGKTSENIEVAGAKMRILQP
ncbi:uncharacterized protein LOC114526072 [Dendronephthya gigantea]|uniref:uncharacterized protein LOC114526072 n=1 Tax=Dendronephthya gigantea TaxID=151771 RepID=UPI00106A4B04|nr:uncharacterized protein LOC114526072 [Dendronephthya gigantea]